MAEDAPKRPMAGRPRQDGGGRPPSPPPHQGWRVTPAPDGRGRTPQQQPGGRRPNSARNQRLVLAAIVVGLLALNLWISSQALKPNPRVVIPYSPTFLH